MNQPVHNQKEEHQLERFISDAVKSSDAHIDEVRLQQVFDRITDDELERWWLSFSSSEALSSAEINVPHWKTKEQKKHFEHKCMRLAYYPKVKTENGKYVYDRKDFEGHIKACLKEHISEDIERNEAWRRTPFRWKLFNRYVPLTLFVLMPLLCWFSTWVPAFSPSARVGLGVLAGACIAVYILLSVISSVMRKG